MFVVLLFHYNAKYPSEMGKFPVRELAEQFLMKRGFEPDREVDDTHWFSSDEHYLQHWAEIVLSGSEKIRKPVA